MIIEHHEANSHGFATDVDKSAFIQVLCKASDHIFADLSDKCDADVTMTILWNNDLLTDLERELFMILMFWE